MKKELFYVVSIDGSYEDYGFEPNGWKTISVYTIENNRPMHFFDLDLSIEDNTKEEIQEWLDGNGFGDDEVVMEEL